MLPRIVALFLYFLPEVFLLLAFCLFADAVNAFFAQPFGISNSAFLILLAFFIFAKLFRGGFFSNKKDKGDGSKGKIGIAPLFIIFFVAIGLSSEFYSIVTFKDAAYLSKHVSFLFQGISGLVGAWLIADMFFWIKHRFF